MTSMIDHVAFQMAAPDSNPQQLGLPYETMMIPLSDGRKLEAQWVDARSMVELTARSSYLMAWAVR